MDQFTKFKGMWRNLADVSVLETECCGFDSHHAHQFEINMLIKMLTGVLKDAILEVSVDDDYRLRALDSSIEFIVKETQNIDFPVGMKFNMLDDLAESILFERYKRIAVIA